MADDEKNKGSGISIKKMLIIWIPLFLVQLVVSYVVIAKYFKPKMNPQVEQVKEEKEKKAKYNKGKLGEFFLVEDIIVNPKGSDGRRFVNLSVSFECENGGVKSEVEDRLTLIRDYLISLISDRTISQIDHRVGKDSLRFEIMENVNEMLPDGGVTNVYFENFIMQ